MERRQKASDRVCGWTRGDRWLGAQAAVEAMRTTQANEEKERAAKQDAAAELGEQVRVSPLCAGLPGVANTRPPPLVRSSSSGSSSRASRRTCAACSLGARCTGRQQAASGPASRFARVGRARSMSQILWPGAGWENPPLGDLADKASTQRYYRKVPALAALRAALQHG